MKKIINAIYALMAASLIFTACQNNSTPTNPGNNGNTYYGDSKTMGNGTLKSWLKTDNSGNPTSVGVTFTSAALQNLPQDSSEHDFLMNLPSTNNNSPFNQIDVDWNPYGHPPTHVYDVPHFDFHFYMISQADRAMITGQGADTLKMYAQPNADYIPAGYMLAPGTGVPNMGAHAVDLSSPELNGGQFTKTFIYGYYNANLIFYEPMITLAYLQTKPNVTIDIKQPAKFKTAGYYPMQYQISYDASTDSYNVALIGLVYRPAQ